MQRRIKVAIYAKNPIAAASLQHCLSAHPHIAITDTADLADVALVENGLLTPTERKILHALVQHGTAKAVAQALDYHPATVKRTLCRIYKKLKVKSAPQAVAVAFRWRLLRDER